MLKSTFGNLQFIIEEIERNNVNANTTYKCFKLGVPEGNEHKLNNPALWPVGIKVNAFRFFRGKSYNTQQRNGRFKNKQS